METRLEWRYAKGVPVTDGSFVYLGDSTSRLAQTIRRAKKLSLCPVTLLFTSPPYCGVTNYHYDQWLRLWLLGGPPNAYAVPGRHRGRFADQQAYKRLLFNVFDRAKPLLTNDSVIYVRTDHRELTLKITVDVLKDVFPKKRMFQRRKPVEKPTQTLLFKNKIEKSEEVDIVLLPAA